MKTFRPTTAGVRQKTVADFSMLTKKQPEKSLTVKYSNSAGRNSHGRVTSRFRGGGHKRKYRLIDFLRDKLDIPATVNAIEYDPNRSAHIALLSYKDGEKRYIVAPESLKVGATVVSSNSVAEIEPGNAMPLAKIPVGTNIYNVELKPGAGGKLSRSAGTFAQLVSKEDRFATVRLPSGEVRRIQMECRATIGTVGNAGYENISIGKAGRTRWMGKRGHVRGTAMNPVDHPHGGGQGRDKGGRHPVSPWGKPTKGKKTRHNKRTNFFIVSRRGKKI